MPQYTPASPYLRSFDLPHGKDTILTIRSFEKQEYEGTEERPGEEICP